MLLDAYYEAGGRFIDTANNYARTPDGHDGTESERLLGDWMAARGNRDDIVLATKVGINRDDRGPSLSAETIAAEIDGSLGRLRTDHVDLYYVHADQRIDPLEETLGALDRAVVAGKARALGCSNFRAWRIEKALCLAAENGWSRFCCVQQRYTFLRPRPGARFFGPQLSADEDLFDFCRLNPEVRLLGYSSLLNGAYARRDRHIPAQYRGAETASRLAALERVAREVDATANQVVYAWMLQRSPQAIPLTAPSTIGQLYENLDALALRLTPEQLAALDGAGDP